MQWTFVGPIVKSGIGQVMHKYAQLLGADYVTFYDQPPPPQNKVFAFLIPQPNAIELIIKKFKPDLVMTVCETEPVHENYEFILKNFPVVLVPSEFCKCVLARQFPEYADRLRLFRHWPGVVVETPPPKEPRPYTFYTIGNALDPRKNIRTFVEAFIQCGFGDRARLVIKATCNQDLHLKIPNVLVINGLLDDTQMERIHYMGDCYVNCSSSEGVGMGAVEAAVRNKPVIVTDYGGLCEYVKTPFVISTEPCEVGVVDFMYQPHMKWGKPNIHDLIKHMKHCFENDIREWNHEYTRELTSASVLRTEFAELSLALARSSV